MRIGGVAVRVSKCNSRPSLILRSLDGEVRVFAGALREHSNDERDGSGMKREQQCPIFTSYRKREIIKIEQRKSLSTEIHPPSSSPLVVPPRMIVYSQQVFSKALTETLSAVGGQSSAGFCRKNPTGLRRSTTCSVGMMGKSSGRGMCVTPKVT